MIYGKINMGPKKNLWYRTAFFLISIPLIS